MRCSRGADRRTVGVPPVTMTPAQLNEEIENYVRPQTFPLGIRMMKPGEPLPEKVRRPESLHLSKRP